MLAGERRAVDGAGDALHDACIGDERDGRSQHRARLCESGATRPCAARRDRCGDGAARAARLRPAGLPARRGRTRRPATPRRRSGAIAEERRAAARLRRRISPTRRGRTRRPAAAPALLDAIAEEAGAARTLRVPARALRRRGRTRRLADAPALLDAIAEEAARRGRSSRAGLANTAWACATAGHARRRCWTRSPRKRRDAGCATQTAGSPTRRGRTRRLATPRRRCSTRSPRKRRGAGSATSRRRGSPARRGRTRRPATPRRRCSTRSPRRRSASSATSRRRGSPTAWAYATAGHAAPALLDAIAEAAAQELRDFAPQNLANGVGVRDGWPPRRRCWTRSPRRRRSGCATEPQNLANMAWAYATAGHAAPALLDAIAEAAATRAARVHAAGPLNTAWAYATAGHAAPALLDAIAEKRRGAGCGVLAAGLANTAWAYATAGHAAPALLDVAEEAARRELREFSPQASPTQRGRTRRPAAAPALLDAIAERRRGAGCARHAAGLATRRGPSPPPTAPRRRSLAATPLGSAARRSAGSGSRN